MEEWVICTDFYDVPASRLKLIDSRRAELRDTQKGKEFIAPPINLKVLCCVRITLFPEIFCHTNINTLDISHCTGISLLTNINSLESLTYLAIKYCGMRKLPNITLPKLVYLDVPGNDLQNLPRGLPIGCPKLRLLYLSYNTNLNRLCETRFAECDITIFSPHTKLHLCTTLIDKYRTSDENFELVKIRYRSIVTLLVAKQFGRDLTRQIAKLAYDQWFETQDLKKLAHKKRKIKNKNKI